MKIKWTTFGTRLFYFFANKILKGGNVLWHAILDQYGKSHVALAFR